MDPSFHYPEQLLRLGSIIEQIHRAKYPELIRKQTRPAPLSKLRDKLDAQYIITEQSVILSCQQSPLCRELFLIKKGGIPRRETVFVLSLLCWLDFAGGTYALVGLVCRMVGGALEDDEMEGMIKAREEIGYHLDIGRAITLAPDETLHMSERYKYFFSVGAKPYEIGIRHSELKQYMEHRQQRPTRRNEQQRPLRPLNGKWSNRLKWKPNDAGRN
jgi:hypothetical protein